MKKVLSIFLAMLCLMMPLAAFGENVGPNSPTIESLWYSVPALHFQLINNLDEFYEYLELISTYYDLEGFCEMVLGTNNYALIDMLIVTLDKEYGRVVWSTPYGFSPRDNLCVFMISTDLRNGYVMNATGDNNENLVVNYSEVAPGTYFMIFYTAQ